MSIEKEPFAVAMRAFLLYCVVSATALAQTYTLSGKVSDSAGHAVPSATVSAKSVATGKTFTADTGSDGMYSIHDLAGGDYVVSAVAGELQAPPITVTLAAAQTTDLTVTPAPKKSELPNAPQQQQTSPANPGAPSLSDLGFTTQQTQANTQLQATLAKRTEMLKIHQRLGLITTIPMAAAVFTGPMAKAKGKNGQIISEPTDANLDFHAALGGLTTALYFTTASYAIFAPRIPDNPKHGGIRWHEALAWVHGPGMILTPVLGYMAYKQENSGEKAHGIAAQHGTVAYVTAIAYGTSIIAVSWPIHVKFWEKQ
jgi:Carboxypeptidase regulatory-like domain